MTTTRPPAPTTGAGNPPAASPERTRAMTKTQTRAPAVFAPVALTVKAQARRDALRNLSAYVDERMSQREWQEMWDAEHCNDEYRSAYRHAVRRLMEAGGDGR